MFYISEKNWNKIIGYAEEAYEEHKSEIGGMSVMVEDKDGDWVMQDPTILEQEISSGNTILDKDALAVYYTKQARKMGKKNFRFCWWHSHHEMKAFWSPTDLEAIDEYSDGDFSFALVVNLKGEYKFRTSIWEPFEVHQDVELEIMRVSRCNKHMKKQVEALCTKRSYSYSWKKPGTTSREVTMYNQGYKSIDQIEEDPRQERLPFRTTAGQTELSGKMNYHEIVDVIDVLNEELIECSIAYKEYARGIDTLNTKLEKENSIYKVKLLPEGKKESLLYAYPGQFVSYRATGEAVWDADFYGGFETI